MQTQILLAVILSAVTLQCAAANPFAKFVGSWGLKGDAWAQRYDGQTTEHLLIPNHRTKCAPVNTSDSILCEVSSPDLQGHILWSYDHRTQTVHHLSNFSGGRNGVGTGTFSSSGDLNLRIEFTSEGPNTYRDYSYRWDTEDQYSLDSVQYQDGAKTSNFYSGAFVRRELNSTKQSKGVAQ